MKRNKLLFLMPSVALATITPVVACSNKPAWTIEDIESAIFSPHDLKPTSPVEPPKDTFYESLNTLSDKDRQKELIYAIYSPLIYLGKWGEWSLLPGSKPIFDLWHNDTVTMSANVSSCSLETKDNKLIANFRGYVNFIFTRDWEGFKTNNFIQITLWITNQDVTPNPSSNWFLNLGSVLAPECWGFFQVQRDSDKPRLFYISTLGCGQEGFASFPKNFHNWSK